ncbi:MAG: glycosyltransferase [Chromatiales bacterium]|jgi:glycosyltransferase involved in cell wall biosynthesis|nr:glycosyltransferase [Chromatiales bacterium]
MARPDPRCGVLVVRRASSPTDQLYALSPLSILARESGFELDVVDCEGPDAVAPVAIATRAIGRHVIVCRYCSSPVLRRIVAAKRRLASLTYVVDDDIAAAAQTPGLEWAYRVSQIRVARREFQELLAVADRVVVTSPWLLERYGSSKTQLLDPPLLWSLPGTSHFRSSRCIISFHATVVHRADLEAIAPALKAIHGLRAQARIEVITTGRLPRPLRGLERCHKRAFQPWPVYQETMVRRRRHILVVPMLDTPFNRGKSHVKVLDAAGLGAVGVYSARAPYNSVVDHGRTGLLVDDSVQSWTRALLDLIDDPARAQAISAAGQARATQLGDVGLAVAFWREALGFN